MSSAEKRPEPKRIAEQLIELQCAIDPNHKCPNDTAKIAAHCRDIRNAANLLCRAVLANGIDFDEARECAVKLQALLNE